MIDRRSHKRRLRDPSEDIRPSYHTGIDYWTNARVKLDNANAEFARRMDGEKYEDVEGVR